MPLKISKGEVPSTNSARRAWIRFELAKRGHTLKSLSVAAKCNYDYIRQAMVRPRLTAETIIARAIGVKPAFIWPERYQAERLAHRRKSRWQHKERVQ